MFFPAEFSFTMSEKWYILFLTPKEGEKRMNNDIRKTRKHAYSVESSHFAEECRPLVEDFFTAKAEYAGDARLNVCFTNGERFEISVRKL